MNDTMQRNTYPVYSLQPLANGKDYLLCIENGLKLPLPNGNLSTVVWHVTQELHCHDFWEICFVVKGSSIQHFLDRSENMHVGSVYIMRPHDVHCISPLQKEMPQNIQSAPYIHRDIYIPCDKMEKICNALREDLYDDLLSRKYPLSSVLPESEISHLEATLNSFNDTENFAFMHSVIVSHILCSVLESQRYPTSQLPAWITELLINLPRDWKLTKADCLEERWSWPIRMMLATAHFAMEDPEVGLESRTTLDEGEDGIPFAENTELRGEILLCPGVFGTDSFFCRLPDGDEVNFYQVIPLYREEIQYKLEHGSDALLDLCPDESLEVINPHRLNVVTDREKISYDPAEMDNAAEQIKKIRALHLPVDELDACNRMAFFLGWAMKRGQLSNPFLSRHREVVEAVRAGKGPDLRVFILDKLDGKLSTQFFDRRGSGFAQWYAQDNRSNPYVYRRDCQNIVLARLKDRVWNSIAEKEAAYLLLPYTEEIRQSVEQLLDERYQQYLEAEFADDPEERVARAAEGKPAVIPDWDGPLFCYASDRVAQDGCKVQIMDRLFPEREDMGWESGWAFYSGDEGDVYGEGDEYYESHCGFYDIRDICRIDPDIVRFLNLPYGTMQMRSEDGAWYEVIRDDEGEEET